MPITEKQTVCVNSGFAHPADTTKQVQFDMSGITSNTPAVIAVPAASGTMALTSSQGVAKAFVLFDGTGATGAKTPTASLNISSVTKNGTGDYTIAFTTAIGSTAYMYTAGGQSGRIFYRQGTKASGSLQILLEDYAGARTDDSAVQFAVFA